MKLATNLRHWMFPVLMAVIAIVIVWSMFSARRVVVPLTFDVSSFCTNQVIVCAEDSAHPVVVALGYNRKVYINALDLHKVGNVNVLIHNFMADAVHVKSEVSEGWDVDSDDSDTNEFIIPHRGVGQISIGEREGCENLARPSDKPDVKLYDKVSGSLLCELYVKVVDR